MSKYIKSKKEDRKEITNGANEDKKDKDIHVNVAGVPKTNVNVKKSSKTKNDDYNLYKISIDTKKRDENKQSNESGQPLSLQEKEKRNQRRALETAKGLGGDSDDDVRNYTKREPGPHVKPGGKVHPELCLTVPDDKNRKVRVVESPNHPIPVLSSEKRHNIQKQEALGKPQKIEFSDLDEVYGTPHSSSYSDDELPYKKQSPQVYYQHDVKQPENVFNVNDKVNDITHDTPSNITSHKSTDTNDLASFEKMHTSSGKYLQTKSHMSENSTNSLPYSQGRPSLLPDDKRVSVSLLQSNLSTVAKPIDSNRSYTFDMPVYRANVLEPSGTKVPIKDVPSQEAESIPEDIKNEKISVTESKMTIASNSNKHPSSLSPKLSRDSNKIKTTPQTISSANKLRKSSIISSIPKPSFIGKTSAVPPKNRSISLLNNKAQSNKAAENNKSAPQNIPDTSKVQPENILTKPRPSGYADSYYLNTPSSSVQSQDNNTKESRGINLSGLNSFLQKLGSEERGESKSHDQYYQTPPDSTKALIKVMESVPREDEMEEEHPDKETRQTAHSLSKTNDSDNIMFPDKSTLSLPEDAINYEGPLVVEPIEASKYKTPNESSLPSKIDFNSKNTSLGTGSSPVKKDRALSVSKRKSKKPSNILMDSEKNKNKIGSKNENRKLSKSVADGRPFGGDPREELIYVGKVPNTTYNVFFSPDVVNKTSEDNEKGDFDQPSGKSLDKLPERRSRKRIAEGPNGILIFVNKKTGANQNPFTYKDEYGNVVACDTSSNETEPRLVKHSLDERFGRNDVLTRAQSEKSNIQSKKSSSNYSGLQKYIDSDRNKITPTEVTQSGTKITLKYPCGCMRILTSDPEQELTSEEVISALCKDGSKCEISRPELQKAGRIVSIGTSLKKKIKEKIASIQSVRSEDGPNIEIVANGKIGDKAIRATTPEPTKRGASYACSINIKSDKFNGIFNIYLDSRLKEYLRNNYELKALK